MIYALVPLLQDRDGHHGLHVFDRGDIITGHYTPEALDWLVEHGHASDERPEDVTPAYSLVDGLTYHGPAAAGGLMGSVFKRGDRVDGILPGPLLRDVISRGEASHDEPEMT